jgi:hypothetical protein
MIGLSFIEALRSDGPASDRADKMSLYGWLNDGTQYKGHGEIHFGWVLEGRAIQDVWILPGVFHGTTFAGLRSGDRRLAHPVERSAAAILFATDRTHGRRRSRRERTMPAKRPAGAFARSSRRPSTG